MMFVRIWQFRADPARLAEFRAAYGASGPWAALFRRSRGYLGTELLASASDPVMYLTVDRWESREYWDAFLDAWREDYLALDRQCESLTVEELELGDFHSSPG